MDLRALLRDAPQFHVDEGQNPRSLQASDEVLGVIDGAVRPGWRTLETGSGLSTVVFALRGAEHVCVTPAAAEVEKIRTYCAGRGIALDRVRFHTERSELVLPRLAPSPLDLVLIDGGHGFPSPFIDWFYTATALKVGGLLVVDDTQLWTGRVLRDFLDAEPAWTLRREFPLRAVVFEKTAELPAQPEWTDQPYVARRSVRGGTASGFARRMLALLGDGGPAAVWRGLRRGR